MTTIAIESDAAIAIGRIVVIDSTSYLAREYDVKVDNPDDAVGVSYGKTLNSSRVSQFIDGPILIDKADTFLTTEQCIYELKDDSYVANPNYDSEYDPVTDANTCYVRIHGLVPVEKADQVVPAIWKKVRNGTTYDWYVI